MFVIVRVLVVRADPLDRVTGGQSCAVCPYYSFGAGSLLVGSFGTAFVLLTPFGSCFFVGITLLVSFAVSSLTVTFDG